MLLIDLGNLLKALRHLVETLLAGHPLESVVEGHPLELLSLAAARRF
jgi:hypothetical protein